MTRPHLALAACLPLVVFGCTRGACGGSVDIEPEPGGRHRPGAARAIQPSDEVRARLLEIAGTYDWDHRYPRVDDRPHFAPGPCVSTKWTEPKPIAVIRRSGAPDGDLHGRKLYFLHAMNYEAYLHPKEGPDAKSPVGQVLIKESWSAQELPHGEKPPRRSVTENGRVYTLGQMLDLFIMMKVDPATPNTDEGWIYAVVSPRPEAKVIEAGALELCAGCHRTAPHDRVFGPFPVDRDASDGEGDE